MSSTILLIGIAKVVFGLIVAVVGILSASRLISVLLGLANVERSLARGNLAIAILESGAILSLALLCRHSVSATFVAMDFLYQGADFSPAMLPAFLGYALVHVGAALALGAVGVAIGVTAYGALTRRIDELQEASEGNPAPALIIAAIMVAIAILTAPGLETLLDGLLPMPEFIDVEHGG